MITTQFYTPPEIALQLANRARKKRLSFNLSQQSLSSRSGVSLGVIKKFERTGKISLESVLKLAIVLESLNDFSEVFKPKPLTKAPTLDALLNQKTRKRGRK